jgi:hypothetical protein
MLDKIISENDTGAVVKVKYTDPESGDTIVTETDKFILFTYSGGYEGVAYINQINDVELCDGIKAIVDSSVHALKESEQYLLLLMEMLSKIQDQVIEEIL